MAAYTTSTHKIKCNFECTEFKILHEHYFLNYNLLNCTYYFYLTVNQATKLSSCSYENYYYYFKNKFIQKMASIIAKKLS